MDDKAVCAECGQQAFTERHGKWTCSLTCECRMLSRQLADARKWAHKAIVARTDDDMFDAMHAIRDGTPFV